MNFLRNFLDKQKPKFEKGGKLEKLHSVFTGFESFLFVPNQTTNSGAHIRDAVDLKRTMIMVVIALVPALLFGMYNEISFAYIRKLSYTSGIYIKGQHL